MTPDRTPVARCAILLLCQSLLACTVAERPASEAVAIAAVEPGSEASSEPSSEPDPPTATFLERGDADAASRFVAVLAQLPGFAPASTTLTFEQRTLRIDPFLTAFEAAARQRGYGARVSAAVGVVNVVSHEALGVDERSIVRTVTVGEVQMRRRFVRGQDGSWRPQGSLFVRGADTSDVRLAAVPPDTAPVAGAGIAETNAARSPVDLEGVTPPRRAGVGPDALGGDEPAAADTPLRNVAELGTSNFVGLFENTTDLEELVLVFANDSMNLGQRNKRRIESLLERVDPDRDLFSIVGCSFGRTAIANGNEVLATGRANRVKEELLFAGVTRDRVLDEGCWAGAPETDFPTRGVVLTVKRQRED